MRSTTLVKVAGICMFIAALVVAPALKTVLYAQSATKWPAAGGDLPNTRSQPNEHRLHGTNAPFLRTKWSFTTGGDVSATPAVADDAVYFPDWAGRLYAVRIDTGALIWSHKVSDYDNFPGAVARGTPAIHGDDLILGDHQSDSAHNGANVMAINRYTGTLHWITQVDPHPSAVITGSAVVNGDTAYVGVSSREEALAAAANYPCCSFRGSMVAIDTVTGQILWQTFTVPDNQGQSGGYSGGAIWQPPAVDTRRGSIFIGTGNNFEVPQSVKDCLAMNAGSAQDACLPPDDMFDTALALDLATGKIKWSKRVQGVDVWTVSCLFNPNPVGCPEPSSPDYDLGGSGPNLLPNLVGFGQKSGLYWAFNPDTGDILWSTVVGPGGPVGGIQWGTATDGERIYVAITNSAKQPYQLIDGTTITWGAWSALDVGTGRILWQTADPARGLDAGSLTVANGLLFAPSVSGNMHALNARTGRIVWTFPSGGSVIDGPSVVDGTVYWGSGYRNITTGTANNKVFAFSLPAGHR